MTKEIHEKGYPNESEQGEIGGFYAGLQEVWNALKANGWVSDDDAFPEADALEIAQKYLTVIRMNGKIFPACMCEVINQGQAVWNIEKEFIYKGVRTKVFHTSGAV